MIHVRETVKDLGSPDFSQLTYEDVKNLILANELEQQDGPGAHDLILERYVAMVVSYGRGHTTDEDVRWH